MSQFVYSYILCFTVAFLALLITRKLTPLSIFGFMWGGAFMVISMYVNHTLECFAPMLDFHNLAAIALPLTVSGLLGGIAGSIFLLVHDRDTPDDSLVVENLEFVLNKFRWIWWISITLGIMRVYMIIANGDIENFHDYRGAYIQSYTELGSWYNVLMRIGNHINIFCSFLVIILAIIMGKTQLNLKRLFRYFVVYSVFTATMGGRLFILSFFINFFPVFLLFYSAQKTHREGELKTGFKVVLCIFALVWLSGYIGISRGIEENIDESRGLAASILRKTSYIGDGLVSAENVLENYGRDEGRGRGANFFTDDPVEFNNYYAVEGYQHSVFQYAVPSVLTPLFFDFGRKDMIWVLGILMLIAQALFCILSKSGNLFGIFLTVAPCRFAFSSALGCNFRTNVVYAVWALMAYLIFRMAIREKCRKDVRNHEK